MKKRFSDEQIVGFLREAATGAKTVEQLAREHGFSPNSFYVWRRKFGAMTEPDVKRACALLSISRRRLGYVAKKDDRELVAMLRAIAAAHPRWGFRSLWRAVNRAGEFGVVNVKRVRRLCRANGLMLKARRRRKRLGIGVGLPCRAEYPNHVWSYDFVEDRTDGGRYGGRKLRILTIVDEFTRRVCRDRGRAPDEREVRGADAAGVVRDSRDAGVCSL